jgi:DNA mismatch repair ATPase MutS
MKTLLMHWHHDFDLEAAMPWNERALTQDLELDTLLSTMSGSDEFLFKVTQKALLCGINNDLDTILYRQQVLKDCLENPLVVRELYNMMVAAVAAAKKEWWGLSSSYPSSLLYSSNDLLENFIGVLRKLRNIGEEHGSRFGSQGFTALFAMFTKELSDEYLAEIHNHLTALKFRKGVLISVQLGESNESINYLLRKPHSSKQNWFERVLGKGPPAYTFHLDPRDEAGGRIMSDMRTRGISRGARALAQSADHVVNFFRMVKTELAFYVGCLNLRDALAAKGLPTAFPSPRPLEERRHEFHDLYDVCLALRIHGVIGNTVDADNKGLIIITGANQGGKSTFLRSIGLAQLMMQCGMFVGARAFTGNLCSALLTHYKREEDATMKSGKFDEELLRMSEIADRVRPNSVLLFNESFAATNEREGSEIAKQIVCALMEKRVKIFYVTHLHEFAHGLFAKRIDAALFLRAERKDDGARTFRVAEGEPLETSYGEDLYRKVFAVETEGGSRDNDHWQPHDQPVIEAQYDEQEDSAAQRIQPLQGPRGES